MEVDNHLSNTKYCLSRLLADRGKEPLYQRVVQAKSIQNLCDALGIAYAGTPNEVTPRGENSSAAKAAGGKFFEVTELSKGDLTHRHESKVAKLRGVSKEAPRLPGGAEETRQTALSV